MTEPFISDPDFVLYVGDVRDVLASLPDESVHCVVTSPPYWGLRDYGTGLWDGGDPDCDHKAPPKSGALATSTLGPPGQQGGEWHERTMSVTDQQFRDTCGKCGARRVDRQLGLEATPDLYVENMVAVFREVRRVLRRDGTLWLNLGDSHANKQLQGVPWKVAFALQADGWYLRADVIWSKPNPMPESVSDRPTKAHEYLFLLTRSPRYFYDADAIREPHAVPLHAPGNNKWPNGDRNDGDRMDAIWGNAAGRNRRSVWEIATEPYPDAHFATFPQALVEPCVKAGTSERGACPVCGAPWEREVELGESDYARIKREQGHEWTDMDAAGLERGVILKEGEGGQTRNANGTVPSLKAAARIVRGWKPSCGCEDRGGDRYRSGDPRDGVRADGQNHGLIPVPCTVLDPFMGSGTTALVARRLGRRSIGVELNQGYAELAARRLAQLSLLA